MGLLDDVLGSVTGQSAGGTVNNPGGGAASMLIPALMAILAAKAGGGGMGNLGGMPSGGAGQAQSGGLGGLLGGLLGGGNQGAGGLGGLLGGGGIAGGLGQLLQTFQQNGYGNVANSWVGSGQNQPIAPHQITEALGPDTIDQLSNHTGLPQGEVASELSRLLPQVIDRLTPQGRLPTATEASQWV